MTIASIGNDIIEIARIRKILKEKGDSFLFKVFTEKERAYCLKYKDSAPHFAGRFSAKEAIAKALGYGIGKELSWQDIEIINNEKGKPEVIFSSGINIRFNHPKVALSISHCKLYATAVAIQTN